MNDKNEAKLVADQVIRRGWYWVVGGLVFSLGTYAIAEPGSSYVVFWGAPLYGLYRVYQGIKLKNQLKDI